MRRYPPPHAGIVLVALPHALLIATRLQMVLDGLATLAGQPLANLLVTIEPGRVRVRR